MRSSVVANVLKIYNFLNASKTSGNAYEHTIFYESIDGDTNVIIKILNGESPQKVMKINISKKFGFFEGNKKVYELFGHAIRRWIDSNGNEMVFNEEDMFIHDDETIKDSDYITFTSLFNSKYAKHFDTDLLIQEISARDIYLYIYAEKFKPFTDMIMESQQLKKVEKELNNASEQLKSNKTMSKSMQRIISDTKPTLEKKYQAYIGVINNQQNEIRQNQENCLTKLDELRKKYEQECKKVIQMKTDKDQQIRSKYDELIKISSNDLNQCITGLINKCDIYKK